MSDYHFIYCNYMYYCNAGDEPEGAAARGLLAKEAPVRVPPRERPLTSRGPQLQAAEVASSEAD